MTDRAPQLVDGFTFSTELDLLELRLELLGDVVDRFVVVEATRTHSGLDKPLHFAENRHRFAAHQGKITHVVVDDLPPPVPDRWTGEKFQRNAIARGLDGCSPDDLVMISDVDELPDPATLERLRAEEFDVAALDLRPAYYRANWEAPGTWPLARIARRRALTEPEDLRMSEPVLRVPDAGVHLSYLMDVPAIIAKYRAFSHQELDTELAASEPFVEAMRTLRVFAPSRTPLTVRSPDELNAVQRWLLARDPSLFDFDAPLRLAQLAGVKWAGARQRIGAPTRLVTTGDRALAGIAGLGRSGQRRRRGLDG